MPPTKRCLQVDLAVFRGFPQNLTFNHTVKIIVPFVLMPQSGQRGLGCCCESLEAIFTTIPLRSLGCTVSVYEGAMAMGAFWIIYKPLFQRSINLFNWIFFLEAPL